MNNLCYLVFVFLIFVYSPVRSQDLTSKMEAKQFVSAAGDTLNYRIYVPEEADSTGTFPLVLFLHGAGERGSDNKAQLKWGVWRFVEDLVQQEHPSIVVAPQAPKGQYWGRLDWRENMKMTEKPSKPLALALQLVEELKQNFKIDSSRLYITGLSMGGFGTWDAVSRHPNMFAAAVPVCGGGDPRQAHRLADLPIWNFHGTLDNVVPPRLSRDMIAAIRYAGGHPGYTEYPDIGHFAWIPAYNEPSLVDWMFSKSLSRDTAE